MSLSEKLQGDLKEAMKAKDQVALRSIRAIKSALLLAATAEGATGEITEAQELQILTKEIKQRKDSLQKFEEQNREDLAQKEREEIEVISRYMPAQMSADEVEAGVKELIAELGAESMKDMGRVMGAAGKKFAGKADNSLVAQLVKKALG